MSDSRQKTSYPTAPIAWMSQAYETKSSTSSPVLEHKSVNSRRVNSPTSTFMNNANNNTVTSLDSFDRPESPTLPPEQDLPSPAARAPIINSAPTSPTRYDHIDTSMPPPPPPPSASYYSQQQQQSMEKMHREPGRQQQRYNNDPNVSLHHHQNYRHQHNSNNNTNPNTPTSSTSTPHPNNSNTMNNNQQQQQQRHIHHSHHSYRKSSRRPAHMSDSTAAAIELSISPDIPPAPAAGMYWSRAITYGRSPSRPLRAHSSNLIGEYLYVFGGCDMKACFNTLYVLDMDTLTWSKPRTSGQVPPPCRAHSCTTVERDLGGGKKSYSLYVFGGGDGPNYFNDLYTLNIDTLVWSKPKTEGEPPSPRRAHTTCIWNQKIIVVGGGDGAQALADVHSLDVSDPQALKWSSLNPQGNPPIARGYHTSNLVKDKLIVYGGSDGHECFSDVHVLDLVSNRWFQVELDRAVPRLAHSSTQVGSYLFVIGGHDGTRYSNEVLLLNLVTMTFEGRKIYGGAPSPRGYHTAVLHDSRLYIIGGYDGRNVFEDVYMLELSACAYLPQITNFEIDV